MSWKLYVQFLNKGSNVQIQNCSDLFHSWNRKYHIPLIESKPKSTKIIKKISQPIQSRFRCDYKQRENVFFFSFHCSIGFQPKKGNFPSVLAFNVMPKTWVVLSYPGNMRTKQHWQKERKETVVLWVRKRGSLLHQVASSI